MGGDQGGVGGGGVAPGSEAGSLERRGSSQPCTTLGTLPKRTHTSSHAYSHTNQEVTLSRFNLPFRALHEYCSLLSTNWVG